MKINKLYEGQVYSGNAIDNSLLNLGKVAFVGVYINVQKEGNISSFCAFPKNYARIDDDKLNKHVNMVMQSILKSKRAMNDISNQDNLDGSSLLYVVNELVEEFYKNGIYLRFNKEYKTSLSGNINFSKTISKKIPKVLDNNLVYDDYIVSQKYIEENLISHCMAYIIKEGTKLFEFYFAYVV